MNIYYQLRKLWIFSQSPSEKNNLRHRTTEMTNLNESKLLNKIL